MMTLPKFNYYRPESIEEALSRLAGSKGETVLAAGGTDLFVRMKQKVCRPESVLDIKGISPLRYIQWDDELKIGALTTLQEICTSSLVRDRLSILSEAARSIGSVELRNRGTIGGNLCLESRCRYFNNATLFGGEFLEKCHKRGGALCHLAKGAKQCYALCSSDLAPVLVALDANLVIAGEKRRSLPIRDFFTGVGSPPLSIGPDEMVAEVRIKPPASPVRGAYLKARNMEAVTFGVLGVAVVLDIDSREKRIQEARIVYGSIAPKPIRAKACEDRLRGIEIARIDEKEIGNIIRAGLKEIRFIPQPGLTHAYLHSLMVHLTQKGISKVLSGLKGASLPLHG
jgi:4-hydroxybenzoyl-CoA reductase subunit beta